MSQHSIRRYLRWYEKKGDEYIADEDLTGIELKELQSLFSVPAYDPMYDCWEVKEEHIKTLQQHVMHNIEIHKHDYFVEASSKK